MSYQDACATPLHEKILKAKSRQGDARDKVNGS
jgi:hypothetical protein